MTEKKSKSETKPLVEVESWTASCCSTADSLVTKEDGEWVHMRCGTRVPKDVARVAEDD